MSEEARGRGRRRLAAILFAGLSRLFPGDEKDSFARLRAFAADVVGPKVAEYGGRIVSVRSEAVLVEFKSVVDQSVAPPLCVKRPRKEIRNCDSLNLI